jgi:hypothetical protein
MNQLPYLDWKEAAVDGGRLTVPFAGAPDSDWSERFERVLERLDRGGGWGEIAVGKKKVKVTAVRQGSESDLRHLLESAALQANADLGAEASEDEPDERSPEDQELTDAFRAFADG